MDWRVTLDNQLAGLLASVRKSPTALTVYGVADLSLPIMSVSDAVPRLAARPASEAVGNEASFLQGSLTDLDVVARLRQVAHDGNRAPGTVNHTRRG